MAAGELDYFAPIAQTRGFLDLLAQFIRELKRLEIWPEELAAASAARASGKDGQLCRLYERYQQRLNEHDLYDAEGRFWSARALLRGGQRKPFESVRHVLVDGFSDFTRTEHEILEILAKDCQSITVSLPLEPDSQRSELFAKSAGTLDRLRRRHPGLVVEALSPPATPWPAMAHLRGGLFSNPRAPLEPCDGRGIEIVSAAGATHELELIAGRIKRLLGAGDPQTGAAVRPDEVLVVLRSLSDAAEEVESVFTRYGIPVAVGERPPLARGGRGGPAGLAAVRARRLAVSPGVGHARPQLFPPRLARVAGRPGRGRRRARGARVANSRRPRRELLDHLARLAERSGRQGTEQATSAESARRAARADETQLAAALVARLAAALDRLPRRASLAGWVEALEAFAADVGLLAGAGEGTLDAIAWRQLVDALEGSEQLSMWVDGKAREISRREFVELVEDIARAERLATRRDEAGRVRVLSAESARNLSAPYVFLAGLSERSFPQHEREECLHSEAETRQLAEAGLPLVPAPSGGGRKCCCSMKS